MKTGLSIQAYCYLRRGGFVYFMGAFGDKIRLQQFNNWRDYKPNTWYTIDLTITEKDGK